MTTYVEKLKLLNWKYLCYRQFYWTLTLFELFIAILVVYVAVRLAEQVIGSSAVEQNEVIYTPYTVEEIANSINYSTIYYTGHMRHNLHVYTLRMVAEIYGAATGDKKRKKAKYIQNEAEMAYAISMNPENVVGLVYLEITKESFKYKIRDKNEWKTSELFSKDESESSGPLKGDPYFTLGFMGLKYFMDFTHLSLQSELNLHKDRAYELKRSFQTSYLPFPYPEYTETSNLKNFVPLFIAFVIIVATWILLCPLIFVIISEKINRIKEMMTLVGVEDRFVWFSWFMNTFIIGIFVFTIVTLILVIDFRGSSFANIQYTQVSLLWAIIMLFFFSHIIFSLTFCTVFHRPLLASSSFCIVTLIMGYAAVKAYDFDNMVLVHLSCIFPAAAFIQAFMRITYYETLEIPLTWTSVFASEYSSADASLAFILIMFVVDTAMYSFLTFYIDAINPGKYGQKKSPLFLFYKKAESQKLKEIKVIYNSGEDKDNMKVVKPAEDMSKQLVEGAPADAESVLRIENLRKKFGPIDAVKGINFSTYKNEILTLVGLAKTGKTTTLSMIVGSTEPTDGSITYKGSIDLLENISEFRRDLGFCPQENRLLPYFTIKDHLVFYGMLKGITSDKAIIEATNYLELMGMLANADDLAYVLSDEMKRKTCISIALMGNSEILVLDEPTTGLDFEAKNKIWNILVGLKKNRTTIMTTQSMSEASAVSDRIAIMNSGLIVCNGSTKFLSKVFAAGYELKMKKLKPRERWKEEDTHPKTEKEAQKDTHPKTEKEAQKDTHPKTEKEAQKDTHPKTKKAAQKDTTAQIVEQVRRAFPGVKVFDSPTEVVFNVPSFDTSKFPIFFKTIEGNKRSLNIDTIGVSCLTLENVFQKIGGESIYDFQGRPLKVSTLIEEALEITTLHGEKLKGLLLLFDQNKVLFNKKFLFIFRNWFYFFYRVVIPTLIMALLIWGTYRLTEVHPPIQLSLHLYSRSICMLPDKILGNNIYENFDFQLTLLGMRRIYTLIPQLDLALLDYARGNLNSYRRDLLLALNATLGGDNVYYNSMYYNKFLRHSLPVVVNVMNNLIYQYYFRNNEYQIVTINHPVKIVNVSHETDQFNTDITEQSPILSVWYILLAFFTIDLLNFITIPIQAERVDGFKHVQLLSGLSPTTYWMNTFIFDFILSFIIMFLRVILFKSFDYYGFLTFRYDFVIVVLLILFYLVSGLVFEYLLTFILGSRYGEYTIFFILNLICTSISLGFYKVQIYFFSSFFEFSLVGMLLWVVRTVILLVPPLNFSLAFIKYIMTWRVNHIIAAYANMGVDEDVAETGYTPYLEFTSENNPNGLLGELIFLVIDSVLYFSLIFAIEFDYLGRFFVRQVGKRVQNEDRNSKDKLGVPADVLKERNAIKKMLNADEKDIRKAVLISDGLRKMYRDIFARKRIVVDDASFLVNPGECFGILGPEESGKTTTIKMLVGEVTPSAGDAWILNTSLNRNRTGYFIKTGYCAQSDSFLQEMTGKEILNLVATLRGVNPNTRNDIVEKWATILGMETVLNQKCSDYNEGDRRKVCAALALIGDPSVVFLDQPATRIDPLSRKSLYSALGRIKSSGQAIVIATPSVQECENLCDRFTIMVKGEMKFIGSLNELKQKYAQAISIFVILTNLTVKDTWESREDDIQSLKFAITGRFKPEACILIGESITSLHYQVNYMAPWSDAFGIMEEIKKHLKFVKEYQLSQKSLDEVLAHFTVES